MTVVAVADAVGVDRKTVHRWEAGTPIPSDALNALAEHGGDVQFVITGVRGTAALTGVSAANAPVLSGDEWELLRRYRSLSDAGRIQARRMLEVIDYGAGATPASAGVNFSVKGSHNVVAGRDVVRSKKPRK